MIIGICDDDRMWCSKAEFLIEQFAERTQLPAEVFCFQNSEELFRYQGEPMDVLFLDIEIRNENGIELAGKVNGRWAACQIVYLTNYLYYATEIYHTVHVFFVLKEQFEQKIGEIFGKLLHGMEQRGKHLIFSTAGGKEVSLRPAEILYFERIRRVTMIETVWGSYKTAEKLSEIQKKLPEPDFIRCHNSYIVYLPAAKEITRNTFLMENGTEILISRSYAGKVKEAFARWALTQIS